jgi:hypothetical protein
VASPETSISRLDWVCFSNAQQPEKKRCQSRRELSHGARRTKAKKSQVRDVPLWEISSAAAAPFQFNFSSRARLVNSFILVHF